MKVISITSLWVAALYQSLCFFKSVKYRVRKSDLKSAKCGYGKKAIDKKCCATVCGLTYFVIKINIGVVGIKSRGGVT